MPVIDPLAERRKEAQQAMESEAHKEARAAKQAELQKQRELARRAMEGDERRKRRETKEKIEQRKRRAEEDGAAAARAKAEAQEKSEQADLEAKTASQKAATATQTRRVESIGESEGFINQLKTKALNLSPLRTFKTDMARAVQEEGVSISKIALSEQARRKLGQVDGEGGVSPRNKIILTAVILAIIVLAGGGVYWKFFLKTTPIVTSGNTQAPTSFIFAETTKSIELTGDTNNAHSLLNKEADMVVPAKTIKHISLTNGNSTLTWSNFVKIWELETTDPLTRNIGNQFMFGVFSNGEPTNNRFLILRALDYPLAYRGLLDWENTMADDLLPLLRGSNAVASERTPLFVDKMIQNKDTRLLKSVDGNTVLIYSFLDQQTIVIAGNEATFLEILGRYKNGSNPNSLAQ